MHLGQRIEIGCPSARCRGPSKVRVAALPSERTQWRALLRCTCGNAWFVAARGLRLIYPHTVRRGREPGGWEFSAHVESYTLAERIIRRWAKEHPGQYAIIEARRGIVLGPLVLDADSLEAGSDQEAGSS